jgi:hypothetical protein
MRWLAGLVGLGCGLLAGILFLIMDPVAWFRDSPARVMPDAAQLIVSGTLGRGVPERPEGVLGVAAPEGRAFADAALRHARVEVAVLDSPETGARALAVKLGAVGKDNSLLRHRLFMDSAWNLVWPGHGSLFLSGRDDYRKLLAEEVWNAFNGEGFQVLQGLHPLTTAARLRGAGGRLAGAEGSYMEYWKPPAGGELALDLAED